MVAVEIVVSIVFLFFNIVLIIKKREHYVPILIINNVLIDVVIGFLSPGEANTAKIFAMTRALINIIAIINMSRFLKFRNLKRGQIFIFFPFVLMVIGLNSTGMAKTFPSILKVLITGFMFGIGYIYVVKTKAISKIFKAFFISIIIMDFNFIISNIFKIGQTSYSKVVAFYSGGIHIGALNTLAILLLSTWFISYFKMGAARKRLYYVATFVLFIFLLISFKRLPILLTILGSLLLLIFNDSKIKSVNSIISVGIVILLSFPLYKDLLFRQFESRKKHITADKFEKESRVEELVFYVNELTTDMPVKRILVGTELFNSVGNYANGYFGDREVHTDHGKLLYGGGFVAWGLYMFGFIYLIRTFLKNRVYNRQIKENVKFLKRTNVLFGAIVLSLFLSTFSEGLLTVTYKTISLMMLGAIAGYIKLNYMYVRDSRNN